MKKLKAAVIGLGNRGKIYANYSNLEPEELEIVALVEPNKFRLKTAAEEFHVDKKNCFTSIASFLKANIECDFVINATMDQIHLKTTLPLLKAGYNLLLEKPIVETEAKLKKIVLTARENGCKICVCHVLRYTPFYSKIKEIIDSGSIGTICELELHEYVWNVHMVNSYVRGKWRNEEECGSPFLLAKSCHDMDLMCWLNNATTPVKVSSFGSRRMYCPENAPEGATQYCHECPVKDKCLYNAAIFEAVKDWFPKYTWKNIDKPYKDITMEEKLEYLKHDIMGQCVYKTDMDIVDRQCVNVEFANGSVGSFNLVGGATKISRHIHIVGTLGEIVGELGENKFTVRHTDPKIIEPIDEVIDFNIVHNDGDPAIDSHFGGDYGIMHNVCAYFRGDKTTSSLTKIEDSINSHLVCYAAEKSRKTEKIVRVPKF
ncbi:MAG: Gfo/Idh/MocA family oxidoreductase [Bacilli bacterium]|nr:Gfo/Idh/MocA family oxidoreductase [Bacilli bacterium]